MSKKEQKVRFQTDFQGKPNIIERQFSQNVTVFYDMYQCFFSPRKKKVLTEKIFKILPEKICKCPRKNLKNCPRKKNCAREKISKITPERKKTLWARKKSKIPPEKIPKVPEKKSIYI